MESGVALFSHCRRRNPSCTPLVNPWVVAKLQVTLQ